MSAHLPGLVGMSHGNMNTETTVPTGEETQNPAPEAEKPEVTTPEVEAEQVVEEAKPEDGEDEATKTIKRLQRRIDKRTADVYRERAQREELARRVAELEAQGTEAPKDSGTDPVVLAKEIAKVERFTEQANSIYKEGVKAHTDYTDALKTLAVEVGPFVQKNGAPSAFMDVVLEVADNPTELLYHLGKNPDIAEELADLSPIKLAKRLDRIERELTDKSKSKPGSAPKPLEPVKQKVVERGLSTDLPIEDWMQRREKELREKRGF